MGKEEATKEDQVKDEPSEKKDQAPDKPSEIGSYSDAISQYEDKQKLKASEAEKKAGKEEPCKPCEDASAEVTKEIDEGTPKKKFYIVDEEGNKTPLIGKADGKTHDPDSIETIETWINSGIHRKPIDEEYTKAKPVVDAILKASKEGNLVVRGEDGKFRTPDGQLIADQKEGEEKAETEVTDETKDPEVKKLEKKLETLEKKGEARDDAQFKKEVMSEYDRCLGGREKHKEAYFAAIVELEKDMPRAYWDLLKETVEIEGKTKPKYNPEQAMKMSHESTIKFVERIIEAHPEIVEGKRSDIIAKYLKEKEGKEEAPVGSPSEIATVVSRVSGKDKPKDLHGFMVAAEKHFEEKEKQGKKS